MSAGSRSRRRKYQVMIKEGQSDLEVDCLATVIKLGLECHIEAIPKRNVAITVSQNIR